MRLKTLSLATVLAISSSTIFADDAKNFGEFFSKGDVSGNIRAMYIFQDFDQSGVADPEGLAVGGKLGFKSANYNGVSAGATFYTTNKAGDFNKIAGTALIDGTDSYSMLGEAYIQYEISKTLFKGGLMELNTPLAGTDDVRIVPNTFEAYLMQSGDLIPDVTVVAGHVLKMAGWDSLSGDITKFRSMSAAAGVKGVNGIEDRGVTVFGGIYSGIEGLSVQAWDYYGHDTVNAIYADASYAKSVNGVGLNGAVQYYELKGVGKLDDAVKVNYNVAGAKVGALLENSGVSATLAYNKVSDFDGTAVFGAWGGYPEFAIAEEFWYNSISSMSNASVAKVALGFNLEPLTGLKGRDFTLGYTMFNLDEAKNGGLKQDTDVFDFIYTCASGLIPNFDVKLVYENVTSDDSTRDSNKYLVKAQYSF